MGRPAAPLRHHSEEHPRTQLAGALQLEVRFVLRFEESTQIVRHGEYSTLPVLRAARVEPDLACVEINLTPLQWQNLARDSPSRDIGELHDGLQSHGQALVKSAELVGLKEPHASVVFAQQRHMRTSTAP